MVHKREYNKDWNFEEYKMSEYTHAIHSYPAMMMPRIARNVIQEYATSESIVLDPYMGSGTTLLEGMVENVGKVIGFDLNPLAVLISTAKTTKFNLEKIKKEIDNLDYHLSVLSNYEHPSFTILESWFKQENIDELARLKAVINNIEDSDVRLFFSVVFSETVRHVSFTRNGEFKLYKIPESKRDSHNPDAIAIFSQKLQSVYTTVKDFYENTTFLNSQTDVSIMNAAITDSDVKPNSIDLVVTSPPYGDSNTTVAYGQFSRLANEWLDFPEPISLDRRLMGGVKAKEIVKFDIAELDDAISMINENEKINDSAIFDSLYNNAEIASIETAATTYSFFYDDIKDNYPSKDDILNKFAYKLFYKLFIFEEPKEFNKEHFLKQLRDFSNKLSFSTYKQEYEKLNELISELDIKDGTTSNIDKLIIAYLNN